MTEAVWTSNTFWDFVATVLLTLTGVALLIAIGVLAATVP